MAGRLADAHMPPYISRSLTGEHAVIDFRYNIPVQAVVNQRSVFCKGKKHGGTSASKILETGIDGGVRNAVFRKAGGIQKTLQCLDILRRIQFQAAGAVIQAAPEAPETYLQLQGKFFIDAADDGCSV